MPQSARIGDIWTGICCCHPPIPCIAMSGMIITGSPNNYSGGPAQARLTDITIGWCGHTGIIVTSSATCLTNSLGKARLSDSVTGCNIGTIVTGMPTHFVENGASVNIPPISTTITFEGEEITYTEVDFGNTDDEQDSDDGLNIFPPVIGRAPTAEEISRSASLDVFPTTEISEDTTAAPPEITPIVSCLEVPDPPPDSFQLTPNFQLSRLSSQTALSKNKVKAQHGLTVQDIVCNLQAWAENIGEPLLAQFGINNLLVTSGFRYASGTSQHERGQAADMQFPPLTNEQMYNIAVWIKENLPFDQLIWEYGGNRPWIHCSFNRSGNRPSTQFNKFGTRTAAGTYQWGKLIYMT